MDHDASYVSENFIQADILRRLGCRPDVRLFRSNAGKVAAIPNRDLPRARAAGLHVTWIDLAPAGTSDLTGIVSPNGRFLAVEVKSARGKQNPAQANYERMVRSFGGIYIIARSPAEAEELLNRELAQPRPPAAPET